MYRSSDNLLVHHAEKGGSPPRPLESVLGGEVHDQGRAAPVGLTSAGVRQTLGPTSTRDWCSSGLPHP